MKSLKYFVVGMISLMQVACSNPNKIESSSQLYEAWNAVNAPSRFLLKETTDFYLLPSRGQSSHIPWSDDYWAFVNGGIAFRWLKANSLLAHPKHYQTGPSLEQLHAMTQDEINMLSPAEKYDLYVGNYDYPTVKEMLAITSKNPEPWEGFCDGWANAAIHYKEPNSVELTGANGIKVRFFASDIKALLTYFQSRKTEINRTKLGDVCTISALSNPNEMKTLSACKDVNPGAFHIVLANMIGLQKKAFVADVTADLEIWNQPFHTYETIIQGEHLPSTDAALDAVKEIEVRTLVTYTQEVHPHKYLSNHTHANVTVEYIYRLELNANNEIVGGRWISEKHPDFLWINPPAKNFSGYWAKLKEIYEAAIQK